MDQNDLFATALGLSAPWKVARSGLEDGGGGTKFLYVDIELEPGAKMPCPCCGALCALYDHEIKRWRHLNFWQHCTYLSAQVPRVNCPKDGVRQIQVPWARSGSGFTLLFEAFIMALVKEMPVSELAELVGEYDTRLWRVVRHYVDQAHKRQDWSGVKAVGVDDTTTRKGHRYATVAVDLDLKGQTAARLLFMTPDRTAQSMAEFCLQMPSHGAQPEQVEIVAMDMSPAYQRGVSDHLPKATKVFDRFHVMKLAGEALDSVRKALRRSGADMKGALWALRGNWHNLQEHQKQLRTHLCAQHKELGRAMALRESLQEAWEWPGPASAAMHLKGWCSWAMRSRLPAFKKLAQTIKAHWDGILAFYPHRITSAAIEAINGVIQTARRRARGFRNFENLRAIAYWMAGKLDIQLPTPFTHAQ